MPRGPLPDWAAEWLLENRWPARGTREWDAFRRADEPALWAAYERELLARWTADHPGTRPESWWRSLAREPRRVTRRADMVVRGGGWNNAGLPPVFEVNGWIYPRQFEAESQAGYLRRLGLLIPGEAERLPARAFAAETVAPMDGAA